MLVLLNGCDASKKWVHHRGIPFVDIENEMMSDGWEYAVLRKYQPTVWINDRLQSDIGHSKLLKSFGLMLATVDDFGTGAALADLHIAPLAKIAGFELSGKCVLDGPEYLFHPQEFAQYRRVRKCNKKWLVTLGGSDTYGATLSVIAWLTRQQKPATVILGPAFQKHEQVSVAESNHLTILNTVPSLAAEMAKHDFAITGGGMTAFEAAAVGLPTAIIANERWEERYAEYLQEIGCSIFLGNKDFVNFDLINQNLDLVKMSKIAISKFDLTGINVVVDKLFNLANSRNV
ncbi:glycosyl transferase [Alphaproteobacteria bacterium]|nr:glycosyl transferase [Alphaproteobacteria bacterium]